MTNLHSMSEKIISVPKKHEEGVGNTTLSCRFVMLRAGTHKKKTLSTIRVNNQDISNYRPAEHPEAGVGSWPGPLSMLNRCTPVPRNVSIDAHHPPMHVVTGC
eukprot:EG_transcript_35774